MARHDLTDAQFARIAWMLPRERDRDGIPARLTNRQVLHGCLWIERTGAPWRDLPPEIGPWNAIYKRYRSWTKAGVLRRVLQKLAEQSDNDWHSIDASNVRVHQDAAGGKGGVKKTPSARAAAVPRAKSTLGSTP